MTDRGFALFDTPVGRCGVVWSAAGLAGVRLPAASDEAMRAGIRGRWPDALEGSAPPEVTRVVERIVALLEGEFADLREAALDIAGVPAFDRRVYEAARDVLPGATLTYGELARRMGVPGAARAVGGALGRNPFPLVVPCHRIVAAGGRPGGFSAPGGVATKQRLLAIESLSHWRRA